MHINYWGEIKRDSLGRAGMGTLVVLALLAIGAPIVSQYQPAEYTGAIFQPPSSQYWLGTNDVGQDIWAQLLYGARTSLLIGSGAALLSTFFSVLAGGMAAVLGGFGDRVLMRAVDALIAVPPVIVAILAAAYFRPGASMLIILLSAFLWPGGARLIRSQALSVKERMHIAAARTFGSSWPYLIRRHIIPDLGPVLTAILVLNFRRAVFMEAGLSFLGVADPTVISWGKMMQQALKFSYLEVWKWWLLPAGAALSMTIAALTFTGFALEKAINPRLKK
ncbi:MAG: ABC transporter permease [Peptococcaceae bacterium BICA1-7]|nr:MAG: ABC transporter permease [Peptococcaceae bacterium BICA1-7]HBV98570.1 ABC transporter permease [Desulfotomaculum sp.]